MEHSFTLLPSALGEGEANKVGDHPNHVDAEAEAEAETTAKNQRRKVQNRKNQRAHRECVPSMPHLLPRSRALKDCGLESTTQVLFRHRARSKSGAGAWTNSMFVPPTTPRQHRNAQPPRPFPLDGLTLFGPYRDDTSVYPLNPNIPFSLVPTRLQQTRLHPIWINFFPFPCLRDNLIRREGNFDHWELLQDLIGELMSATPVQKRRGTPLTFTVSDPQTLWTLPLTTGRDEDEITAGRKGLIVWGEPYDVRNWEATPGFLAKWSWAVEGCDDLVESSNRWRLMRGEEPICLSE
ncbi:hypothetical protein N7481_011763 [Penicillium waksmanii]|uniref:uncharacterized protein n=1 Tax=Penicillium waksmanii TaxID=69791 RepID=UPI002549103B|nr:uncharacterized protein N7481_011763 [Penicillium waksmanii]KAJ5974553.1 hypothetical protein N7481_011763 [Penicillium waksmanii]